MKQGKSKTIFKAVGIFLALVLVVSLGAVIFKITNGFTEEIKTFYIEYEDEKITSSNSEMILYRNRNHTFKVKSIIGGEELEKEDYQIKIIPNTSNSEADFDFMVGEDYYSFLDEPDLTKGFDIIQEEHSFTIKVSENASMQSVLEKVYAGKPVVILDEGISSLSNPFTLVISNSKGKGEYYINFSFEIYVTGVTLDPEILEI